MGGDRQRADRPVRLSPLQTPFELSPGQPDPMGATQETRPRSYHCRSGKIPAILVARDDARNRKLRPLTTRGGTSFVLPRSSFIPYPSSFPVPPHSSRLLSSCCLLPSSVFI